MTFLRNSCPYGVGIGPNHQTYKVLKFRDMVGTRRGSISHLNLSNFINESQALLRAWSLGLLVFKNWLTITRELWFLLHDGISIYKLDLLVTWICQVFINKSQGLLRDWSLGLLVFKNWLMITTELWFLLNDRISIYRLDGHVYNPRYEPAWLLMNRYVDSYDTYNNCTYTRPLDFTYLTTHKLGF